MIKRLDSLIEKIVPSKNKLRTITISTAGKLLHTFIGGGKNLEKTSANYIKKVGVNIVVDSNSQKELEDFFKQNNRGVIILKHKSGVFSDYLPIFKILGDKVLKNTIFYTGEYNLSMNKREFPNYTFKRANITSLKNQVTKDAGKIKESGGYIFIIPSGENTEKESEFKAIFKKIVKELDNNFPVLASNIEHKNWKGSYKEIGKQLINYPINTLKEKYPKLFKIFPKKIMKKLGVTMQDQIYFKGTNIGLFKGKDGKKMNQAYLKLFKQ